MNSVISGSDPRLAWWGLDVPTSSTSFWPAGTQWAIVKHWSGSSISSPGVTATGVSTLWRSAGWIAQKLTRSRFPSASSRQSVVTMST